jgi:DNA ligase-1
MVTLGVTSATIKRFTPTITMSNDTNLMYILQRLASRALSGNEALDYCASFIRQAGGEYEDLLYKIFDKDLKIGADTKTINSYMGLNIPVFEVALAHDIHKSPTYGKRVEKVPYIITRKLDGVRLICQFNADTNAINFYSRIGHPYTSLDVLKDALLPVLRHFGTSCYLDGELCVIDENNKENFKQAVSEIRRHETMVKPHYKMFDMLTPDEFLGISSDRPYHLRLNALEFMFQKYTCPNFSVIGHCKYTPENFDKATQLAERKGWEGLILRADLPYQSGRTADLLKVKKFTDDEFVIEDITGTTKNILNALTGKMEETPLAGAMVIRYKGNPVAVGSGLSDELRIDLYHNPEKYLGRKITVKYFEETTDATGKPSLRFPIFKGFRDLPE